MRTYWLWGVWVAVVLIVGIVVAERLGDDSDDPPEHHPSKTVEPEVPGEGTAFKATPGGMTVSEPQSEYMVNRSIVEFLRSRHLSERDEVVQPSCRELPEPIEPVEGETVTECEIPYEVGTPGYRWVDFHVNQSTGKVTIWHQGIEP